MGIVGYREVLVVMGNGEVRRTYGVGADSSKKRSP